MTDTGKRREIAGALAAALDVPEETQLSMLPAASPRRGEIAREIVRRDRAGRPEGARNLATRDMLEYVRRILGDPVLERARWAMHTPESLALVLGCTKLEAFDRIDKIRSELARLFYAPLAPVDNKGNAVAPFFAMFPGAMPGAHGAPAGGSEPWDYMKTAQGQVIENADNSAASPAVSHGAVSHGDGK